ncbi:MAG: phage tail tape measure protein, partial [Candidatus Sericytochromatia bacterium]|nr:phage tail tape measure protein [Candidatus Sericytochromatia bacterium]
MSDTMTLSMLLMLKDAASGGLGKFTDTVKSTSAQLIAMGQASKMMGQQILNGLRAPIDAFTEAEDAALRLDAAMMGANNQSHKLFPEMKKHAVELGNELPGTARELQMMFAALIKEGVAAEDILGGIGRAAGSLAVITGMGFEESAKFVGQVSKAMRIEAKDMTGFIDTIQRAFHTGVSTVDLGYAFAKSKGALDRFGIAGKAAADDLAPLFSLLIKSGQSGETVGTNITPFLSNLYDFEAGNTAKKLSNQLKAVGVELDIFGKDRKFLGADNLVKQLEKIKTLPIELQDAFTKQVFGGGVDGGFAQSLIGSGSKDLAAMKAEYAKQADLTARIQKILTSFKNIKESAMGAFETLLAGVGESIGPELKAMADGFGWLSDKILAFTQAHPQLTKMLTLFTLISGAGLAIGGSLMFGLGAAMSIFGPLGSAVAFASTRFMGLWSTLLKLGAWNAAAGAKLTAGVAAIPGKIAVGFWRGMAFITQMPGRIGTGLARMGSMFGAFRNTVMAALRGLPGMIRGIGPALATKAAALRQSAVASAVWFKSTLMSRQGLKGLASAGYAKIVAGFRAVGAAIKAAGMATMANPLGIIAGVLAIAALLVYKYWKPITGFFKGVWQGLKAGLAPVLPMFKATFAPLAPLLRPLIGAVRGVWNWFKNLIKPVDDVGGRSQAMGVKVGQAIAKIINKGTELLTAFSKLPGELMTIGTNMAQGLIDGFMKIPIVGSVVGKVR